MYKIAIITSLYRAEKYLSHFLKNITVQTIFHDCCLYLVDGNSPEEECEIVQPYLEKYSNITYQKLPEDPGIYACWNLAIEKTDSQYITNANVDDRLFPSAIEKHVRLLDLASDIDVAYCYNIESVVPNVEPLMLTGQQRIFTTDEFSIKKYDKG